MSQQNFRSSCAKFCHSFTTLRRSATEFVTCAPVIETTMPGLASLSPALLEIILRYALAPALGMNILSIEIDENSRHRVKYSDTADTFKTQYTMGKVLKVCPWFRRIGLRIIFQDYTFLKLSNTVPVMSFIQDWLQTRTLQRNRAHLRHLAFTWKPRSLDLPPHITPAPELELIEEHTRFWRDIQTLPCLETLDLELIFYPNFPNTEIHGVFDPYSIITCDINKFMHLLVGAEIIREMARSNLKRVGISSHVDYFDRRSMQQWLGVPTDGDGPTWELEYEEAVESAVQDRYSFKSNRH